MLAGFPAERIRTYPAAGTATEVDVPDAEARSDRTCEVIGRVLVEKIRASMESALALASAHFIHLYLDHHNLGSRCVLPKL